MAVGAVEAAASAADALALAVADLSVGRHARVLADGALAGPAGPSRGADALATVALAVLGTDLAVVSGTVEVVALAELAGDLLLRVGAGIALAAATVADASPLADGRLVRPLALLVQGGRAHTRSVALAVLADVASLAPAHSAHHVPAVALLRVLHYLVLKWEELVIVNGEVYLLFAVTVTEHLDIDQETLVEAGRPDAEEEVPLVDAVGVLQGHLELDLIAHPDPLADIRVPEGRPAGNGGLAFSTGETPTRGTCSCRSAGVRR